jgi:hypothetical protein
VLYLVYKIKGDDIMIKANDIMSIKSKKVILDKFEVVNAGANVFSIIGFNYGERERKFTGYADEVAKWLNEYFGLH